jgi:hypothetical protein
MASGQAVSRAHVSVKDGGRFNYDIS